ncbi:MAG TPA: alpha-L-arabinofuranosidase C-terminal domain-containing protein [Steroidobacteraceae bacterium]|nr:alpha-L-arabinofuranosidase C-terminal domain-containing protein [Steroidobacteraceae bacterium]
MQPWMRARSLALVLGVAAFELCGLRPCSAQAEATQQPALLTASAVVHVDTPGAKIDRHLYGQFAEHLGRGIYEGIWVGEHSPIPNTHGFRNDVIAALRELHVPLVRWPGGCFADEYHWRDGIGARTERPVTLNTNWGGVPETNEFGTHEFLEFTRLIGAEAYISGNLGTGSPREMAEWLQYLTSDKPTSLTLERARNGHPGPWKIAYFGVGNETWGCGGNMTPQYYIDLLRRYATYLKAPEGARPLIVASGGHDEDTAWTEALIAHAADVVDLISFHYYTLPGSSWQAKGAATGFTEEQWISTLAHTLRMEEFIARNSAVMDRYDPGRKVAFAVDEWGTWYDPEPGREPGFLYQQNTLRDALVAALNLNIFQRHAERVRMASIAQMVNVLQSMILTRGRQMLLTPTYHVFRMFRPFQDSVALPVEVQGPPYRVGALSVPGISVSAARAQSTVLLALVNLNPHSAATLSIGLNGFEAKRASGELLSAPATDAHNTFEHPDAVQPIAFSEVVLQKGGIALTLPAKSVLVLSLT